MGKKFIVSGSPCLLGEILRHLRYISVDNPEERSFVRGVHLEAYRERNVDYVAVAATNRASLVESMIPVGQKTAELFDRIKYTTIIPIDFDPQRDFEVGGEVTYVLDNEFMAFAIESKKLFRFEMIDEPFDYQKHLQYQPGEVVQADYNPDLFSGIKKAWDLRPYQGLRLYYQGEYKFCLVRPAFSSVDKRPRERGSCITRIGAVGEMYDLDH